MQNLHCRGLCFFFFFSSSQMHRIRHSSCLISAALFSCSPPPQKKRQKGERQKEKHTLVQVLACLAHLKTARPGLTHLTLSLSRSRSVCVFFFFCSSEKKEEVRMHENAKGSRRCTKALCESLLSNNATVTAAPLFQFQAPLY